MSIMERPAEFDARVLAYLPGLEALAKRLTRDEDAREELVQGAIVHALTNWQGFREDGGFWGWLRFCMLAYRQHCARGHQARKRRGMTVSLDSPMHGQDAAEALGLSTPPDQHSALEMADTLRLVDATLSPRDANLIKARLAGYTLDEIREGGIGVSRQRVLQIENAAFKKLRAAAGVGA